MIDLNLHDQQYAEDYGKWSVYYNYMQVCFYVTRISKQCARFNRSFPWSVNWQSLHTDKFVLTNSSNRATIGRNFNDTHFVQDTYYNPSRFIFNHPDANKIAIKHELQKNNHSNKKPFAMQYIIGAIEASDKAIFLGCMQQIGSIDWSESNW